MFEKGLDTSKFWVIKVASFKISDPDSVEVKFKKPQKIYNNKQTL